MHVNLFYLLSLPPPVWCVPSSYSRSELARCAWKDKDWHFSSSLLSMPRTLCLSSCGVGAMDESSGRTKGWEHPRTHTHTYLPICHGVEEGGGRGACGCCVQGTRRGGARAATAATGGDAATDACAGAAAAPVVPCPNGAWLAARWGGDGGRGKGSEEGITNLR